MHFRIDLNALLSRRKKKLEFNPFAQIALANWQAYFWVIGK